MQINSPAKINLTLEILGRLQNGYHELATIFQTLALSDRIAVDFDSKKTVLHCRNGNVPVDESNLILKALRAVERHAGKMIPCAIELEKNIPMGAGLGGGSGNAAAMLLALGERFSLSKSELQGIAASLGADVPFFLMKGTAVGGGIGEKLEPLPPLPSWPVVIVKPPVSIRTALAYENVKRYSTGEKTAKVAELIRSKQFDKIFEHLTNDFEPVVFTLHPEPAEIKKALLKGGALAAQMSGSGSAFFAFARDLNHANALKQAVAEFGEVWVTST